MQTINFAKNLIGKLWGPENPYLYIHVGPGAQSEDAKHFQRGLCQRRRNRIRSESPKGKNEEESLLGWVRLRTEGIVYQQERQFGPFQGRG